MRALRAWCTRTARAAARGVWGHAPQEFFGVLDALRTILVHSGTFVASYAYNIPTFFSLLPQTRLAACPLADFARFDMMASAWDVITVYGCVPRGISA